MGSGGEKSRFGGQSNMRAGHRNQTNVWDGSGSWSVAVVFPDARGGPGGGNWPSLALLWYSGLRRAASCGEGTP